MPLALDQFVRRLAECRLPAAAGALAFFEKLDERKRPRDTEALARLLVESNLLTAYQAEEIYRGAGQGLMLGNYVILDKLGAGGMGLVFKAEHRRLERLVALKVLSSQALESPAAVQRFQREAKAVARLEHANIAAAYDADEAGGKHFLVMQFVDGLDLQRLVARTGPLTVEAALACVAQAAAGLEYAHRQGIVHRDIKPENLLLDKDGTLKILDMGLARLESPSAAGAGLTGATQIMGTVDYMPPEQAIDSRHADERSDIYSLGATLWYLLTGRQLYLGDTLMAILVAHREEIIPSLREVRPEVSASLEAMFEKMVAKSPRDRYQMMREVLAEIELCRADVQAQSPGSSANHSGDSRDVLRGLTVPAAGEPGAPGAHFAAFRVAPAVDVDSAAKTVETDPHTTDLSRPVAVMPIERTLEAASPKHSRRPANWLLASFAALFVLAVVPMLGLWILPLLGKGPTTVEKERGPALPSDVPASAKPRHPLSSEPLPQQFENTLGMKFALVPQGTARLGGGNGKPGEKVVEIPRDFYLGAYEVTQEEWESLMGTENNPSHFSRRGENKDNVRKFSDEDLKKFPVDSVSWYQCQEFITKLNQRLKEPGWKYRLPTDVEWEYACRGGPLLRAEDSEFDYYLQEPSTTLEPNGANFTDSGKERTCPVGSYAPNRLGLFDMHGNVFELCDNLVKKNDESLCLLVGGGWLDGADACRASNRNIGVPSGGYNGSGLRLALVKVEPETGQ